MTALSTLALLERLGPRRISALTAAQGLTQPAMSQLCQRLEDRGLVTIDPDPEDGRAMVVTVTRKGRATLEVQAQRANRRVAELLAELPEADVLVLADAIAAVLPRLRDLVSRVETPSPQ